MMGRQRNLDELAPNAIEREEGRAAIARIRDVLAATTPPQAREHAPVTPAIEAAEAAHEANADRELGDTLDDLEHESEVF